MIDLNLWQPADDLADDYVTYKHLHEELAELFTRESGMPFDLYKVEHVFWFKGGNPYGGSKSAKSNGQANGTDSGTVIVDTDKPLTRLPESYVPPIVAILPRMALNESGLEDAAKASGTSLVRAFEKSIHAAFTILGFDTKLLGQVRPSAGWIVAGFRQLVCNSVGCEDSWRRLQHGNG